MFKEFVKNKNDSKINVITITEKNPKDKEGLYASAKRLKYACERRGFPFIPIVVPGSTYISEIDLSNKNVIIRDVKTKKVIELDPQNTVVIIRGSVVHDQTVSSMLTYLESRGLFMINNKESIELCANKYNTTIKLMAGGVPVPRTHLINKINEMDEVIEKIGGQFPIVLKTLRGSHGIGVSRIDSRESLTGVLQAFWKQRAQLLVQEFLDCQFDVRTIVMDGKIISCMKRNKIGGDFRSNFSLGGTVEKYKLSEKEEKAVIDAAKLCGTFFCGVDHMVVDGKPLIIEVNASPGSDGMFKATGINTLEVLMDYISDKNNWKRKSSEIGYIEKIEIPELGLKLEATSDTGNGMYNVLDAKNIKVIDNIVSFKINGKKFVKKLQGMVEVNVGGIRDFVDKRPLVKFDIKMKDFSKKDVTFTLDDRPKSLTPVLLSRDFLAELGVTVNPKLKFTLGENVSFKDFREMFI